MTGQAGRRGLDAEERGAGLMAELGVLANGNPPGRAGAGTRARSLRSRRRRRAATRAGGPRSPVSVQIHPVPSHRERDAGAQSS